MQELATSKDMPGEAHGYQPETQQAKFEQRGSVSTQLTTYIDRIETRPRDRLERIMTVRNAVQGINEPEELQQEIARLESMKQEVQQGNFSSIATELQARRAEPEARLAELRPQLRPRGEMHGDDGYYALKDELLAGEKILEKVRGVLNESEQAWIARSIENQKNKQSETARGRLMRDINTEQQTLNEITHLQQLISQPPQS